MKKIILILIILFSTLSFGQKKTKVFNEQIKFKSTPNLSVVDSILTKDSNDLLSATSFLDFQAQLGLSPVPGTYLQNIVEDLTPQLGGGMDLNNFDITGNGNINHSGSITTSGTIQGLNATITNDVLFSNYTNTRIDATALNFLHTDASGNLQSSPISSIVSTNNELTQVSALWTSLLNFDVTATSYPVNDSYFSSTSGVVTLDAADATLDRVDLIVAIAPVPPAIVGTVGFEKGTPAANPSEPDFDASLVYPIKFVLVKALATTPDGFSDNLVFDENVGPAVEWTATTTANLVSNSTNDAFSGTISVEGTNTGYGDKTTFTSSVPIQTDDLSSLSFYIKLKTNLSSSYIFVKWFNGSSQVGSSYLFNNNKNGLNSNNNNWQKITIDASKFNLPSGEVDGLQIYPFKNSYTGYFIDLVEVQDGTTVVQPPGSTGIAEAPIDGVLYGRKNAQWSEITSTNSVNVSERYFSSTQYGAISDADISLGSTSFGTDNLTILQQLLDEALTSPITVLWDGKYSVSDTLKIHSNTNIIGSQGSGVILRNSSNSYVFKNNNSVNPELPYGDNIIDENITIQNLIINGNGYNSGPGGDTVFDVPNNGSAVNGSAQTKRNQIVDFLGVRNLVLRDVQLLGGRYWACHLANVQDVVINNLLIDFGESSDRDDFNYDGVHFKGGSNNVRISNLTLKNCKDDNIALNAYSQLAIYIPQRGAITNITMENIYLESKAMGIGLYSETSLSQIDNIYINNVRGFTESHFMRITNGEPAPRDGNGFIGTVTLENVNVDVFNGETLQDFGGLINVRANIDKLILKNLIREDFTKQNSYIRLSEDDALIKELIIDGVQMESSGGTWNKPILQVSDGLIEKCIISNVQFKEETSGIDAPIVLVDGGIIDKLSLSNIMTEKLDNIVKHTSGSLNNIIANNINQDDGVVGFSTSGTINEIYLSNYDGLNPLGGTFTKKKGSSLDYLGEFNGYDLPLATYYSGSMVSIIDETSGYTRAFSDGVNWKRVYDYTIATYPTIDFLTSLVAYYKFDNNSNDFTTIHNGIDTSISYTTGQVGNCSQYGVGYVSVTDNNDFSFTDGVSDLEFSMIIPFYHVKGSTVSDEDIISKRGFTTEREYYCRYDDDANTIIFRIQSPTSTPNDFITVTIDTSVLSDNTWNHLVITNDGSETATGLKAYLNNGSAINGVMTGTYTGMVNGNNNLVFGSSSWDLGNGLFNGRLDDLAIYKGRVLNISEISIAYNQFILGSPLIP